MLHDLPEVSSKLCFHILFPFHVSRQLRKSDLQSSEVLQGLREKLADKLGSQNKADDGERKGELHPVLGKI